jgi:hypothetical protein
MRCLVDGQTLTTVSEGQHFSETYVSVCQSTQRKIAEDLNLNEHRCHNFEARNILCNGTEDERTVGTRKAY